MNLVNDDLGGPAGVYVFRVDGNTVIVPGTVTMKTVTNTGVYHTQTTIKTDPPTIAPSTMSPRFIEHLANVRDLLNETGEYANNLCPFLLEKPSLQSRCFDQWMELDNRIIETNNASELDELYTLETDVATIKQELELIDQDAKMSTKLPPFDISEREKIFISTWHEIMDDIDDINIMAQGLCPQLIKFPAVQQACFQQWKKLDNELLEMRNVARSRGDYDALTKIRDAVNNITKELKRIRKDSNQNYI